MAQRCDSPEEFAERFRLIHTMARWLEYLTLIAVIGVLAGLSLWLQYGLLDSGNLTQLPDPDAHTPDYTVENFTAKGTTDEGLPAWVLKGDRLVHYPDDDSALIDNPDLIEYEQGEKIRVIVYSGENISKEKSAGEIVKSISQILGGAGGGSPKFAQGGGTNKSKKEDAIKNAKSMIIE